MAAKKPAIVEDVCNGCEHNTITMFVFPDCCDLRFEERLASSKPGKKAPEQLGNIPKECPRYLEQVVMGQPNGPLLQKPKTVGVP
jgi:hypothetical protein